MKIRTIVGRVCAHCGSRAEGALFPSEVLRFLSYVETSPDCWRWKGYIDAVSGYGRIGLGRGVYQAHRVSYEHFVGPVPEGKVLDHTCRNRWCVNPAHLEPVSNQENSRRGRSGRCKRGHPLEGDNLIPYPLRVHGRRSCRACTRAWQSDRRRAARATA
jgi:hypothetical protein